MEKEIIKSKRLKESIQDKPKEKHTKTHTKTKTKHTERILKAAREKPQVTYKGNTINS